jgi:hypothetical protein
MKPSLVIHGKVSGQVFVPDEPIPDIEGPAELIVYPAVIARSIAVGASSVFDFIGKAFDPRFAEELDAQLREERNAWNDPCSTSMPAL